jgi:hypothetical protein
MILAILVIGFSLMSISLPAKAADVYSGSCGSSVYYSFDPDSGMLTISGSGAMADYSSASPSPWYSFTGEIKQVSIESGVTIVGSFAFNGCALTSLLLSETVTSIKNFAFYRSALSSLSIPNSVTSIGSNAFALCANLETVSLGDGLANLADGAFINCTKLRNLVVGNCTPSFLGYTFGNNSLETITVSPDNPVYDSRDNCNAIIRKRDNHLMLGSAGTVIVDSVTWIDEGAFDNNNALVSMVIPASVRGIGTTAFLSCRNLKSVIIEEGVGAIYDMAFHSCSNLELTVPNSVTTIGSYAFASVKLLKAHCDHPLISQSNLYGASQYEPIHYLVDEVVSEPTCQQDGVGVIRCEKGDYQQSYPIAGGHLYGEPAYQWSEDNLQVTGTMVCQRDNAHVITETADCSVACTATCTQAGETTYIGEFADARFETQKKVVATPALGHQWGEWIVDDQPSCTQQGHRHRVCLRDESHREDEDMESLGHDYQFSRFEWEEYEAKAVYVCSHDESHVITAIAEVFSEVTTEPGCESTGIRTYTASYDGHTDTKEEELPALGHDWGDWEVTTPASCEESGVETRECSRCHETENRDVPATGHDYQFSKFEWEEYEAKAVYVCSHDESHVITAVAEVTSEVTLEPGCESAGIRTYTASYDGHSDTKEEELPALGHDWGEPQIIWNQLQEGEEYPSGAVGQRICQRDNSHEETVECQISVLEQDCLHIVLEALAIFADDTHYSEEKAYQLTPVLEARIDSMSTEGITLVWNDLGADAYEVHRKNYGGQQVLDTTYTDPVGRTMGETYTYVVKAMFNGEYIAISDELTVMYNPFIDVPNYSFSFTHVAWAYNHRIVNGLSNADNLFGLTNRCSRVQFCYMLWNMNGKPSTIGMSCPFTDIDGVSANNKKAIIWCYNQKIVNGTSATTFAPKGDITRAQLAIMIWKMAGQPSVEGMSCPYTDLGSLSANNQKAVIWCYNKGLIDSLTGTKFSPKTKGTRALLTEMLYGYEQWYHIVDPAAADTTTPLISVLHDSEQVVKGQAIGLLPYAVVEDDLDDHLILKLEGNYDFNKAGSYPLKFVAVDQSGNRSEAPFTLNVVNSESELQLPYPHHPKGFDYKLVVNIHNQTVRVYRWDGQGYNDLLKIFTCSTGTSTPKRIGSWQTPEKYRWKWLFGNVYGQYATRIKDTCLFHSVPYFTKKASDLEYLEYNKLGTACSMGCVRLRVIDVKWIYDNGPVGTTVVIKDDASDTIPVQWLEPIDVNSPNRGWDPTDPDPNNPWHK